MEVFENKEMNATIDVAVEISEIKEVKKQKKDTYKTKECKVLGYHESIGCIDVEFDGSGIRMKTDVKPDGDIVIVKYKGKIGKKDFVCKLK